MFSFYNNPVDEELSRHDGYGYSVNGHLLRHCNMKFSCQTEAAKILWYGRSIVATWDTQEKGAFEETLRDIN